MQNQGNSGTIVFAELETQGRRIECPRCRVTINLHLGNLIAPKFQCESCKANLSYRNSSGRSVRCPCCNFARPVPNSLITLVCGGCEVTIIYQKGDRAVKCSLCKHITTPPVTNYGVRPVNRVVPQDNRVVPQDNRVAPPQVNQVAPPHVNRVVPPQVNRNRRSRTVATVETESSASSCITSKPAEITKNIEAETAELVAQIVRNAALRAQRESEEDKTEEAKSKKKTRF